MTYAMIGTAKTDDYEAVVTLGGFNEEPSHLQCQTHAIETRKVFTSAFARVPGEVTVEIQEEDE